VHDLIVAAVVGVVEGLTEFLPVSSTGHMILVENLLGFHGEAASVFAVFIQLGAILSVALLYREKYLQLVNPATWFRKPVGLSVWHIAAGIVPVGLVGFLAHGLIKRHLFSSFTVIIGLILGGLLMLAAEKCGRQAETTDVEAMTLKQAFYVGLFQILSLWPGFSRSGSTISGGIFFGLDRKTAADFSFIIALPLMTMACFYDLAKSWSHLSITDFQMIAVGFVVSFIVAYFSVIWFLRFLNKSTLASFAYYRFVLAAFSYYYFFGH
jgi:undecaprenyl-diphosphatase